MFLLFFKIYLLSMLVCEKRKSRECILYLWRVSPAGEWLSMESGYHYRHKMFLKEMSFNGSLDWLIKCTYFTVRWFPVANIRRHILYSREAILLF